MAPLTDLSAPTREDHRDIEAARRVIATEVAGLTALAKSLDRAFVDAIEIISRATGRVIVTGMGKSGHIARKIASTLASTGTPALFVHPGEASHGDLGMIAPGDVVIALSNSGDTAELADVLAYTRRFRIPLVAMTRRSESALSEAADVALLLPASAEACTLGLAPTTSTTMMLALGDAVAVALLERKGFSAEDFQALHPGGRLGQQLLRVADIMHEGAAVPLVKRGTTMAEALLVMTAKSFGCAGVVDEVGRLVGIVTDGDLRRHIHMGPDLMAATVDEVMTRNPKTISRDTLAGEALELLNSSKITALIVTDANKPVGIVHLHDLLRAGVA